MHGRTITRRRLRALRAVTGGLLGVAALIPIQASAAPTIAPGGTFPFRVAGEDMAEISYHGIVADRGSGDVFVAGSAFRTEGTTPEDQHYVEHLLLRRFSAAGAVEQTLIDASSGDISDLALSLDGLVLYAPTLQRGGGTFTSVGVRRIDAATGAVLGSFATPGTGPGNFSYVHTTTVAPDGDVYVMGSKTGGTTAIARFSAGGVYEASVPLAQSTNGTGYGKPGVDPRNGDILVFDEDSIGIHIDRYSKAGAYRDRIGGETTAAGGLSGGIYMPAIDVRPQDGAVYANGGGSRVWLYAANGGFVGSQSGTREFMGISARPDGSRLWSIEYGAQVRWFGTGTNAAADPAPVTDPEPTGLTPHTPPSVPAQITGAGGTAAPVDVTGPAIVVPSSNKTLTASGTGVIAFRVGPVAEDATGVVTLRSAKKVATSRKAVLGLGTKSFQVLKGRTVVVKIRMSKKARKLVAKRRRLAARAQISLRDARGNLTVRSFRLTVKAPKRKRS
jgi:hypothetical protein